MRREKFCRTEIQIPRTREKDKLHSLEQLLWKQQEAINKFRIEIEQVDEDQAKQKEEQERKEGSVPSGTAIRKT